MTFKDQLLHGMTIRESATDGSDFTNPAADYRRLFLGEDGLLHVKDSAGTVTDPYTGGGSSSELDYAQITSPVAPTATTEATANTVVTGAAVAYDGSTPINIEFFSPQARAQGTTNAQLILVLYDGAASIGLLGVLNSPSSNPNWVPLLARTRITPSAATHTYSIRAFVSTGTASIQAGAGGLGAVVPAFMRITAA
jgi:hypothetical protein